MKRDITVILLCFVAAAGGANVQPILSGAGKLIFPENAIPATISASSGHLTLAAGATNGNIILTPSGTGQAGIGTTSPGIVTTAGRRYLTIKGSTLGGVLEFATAQADASGNVVGTIQASDGNNLDAELRVATMQFLLDGATANHRGGKIVFVTKADSGAATAWGTLDRQGFWGFGGNTSPAYAVDATGDVNASGVFRKGGTAGISGLATSTHGGGSCVLTISGGIITGTSGC
jgi:hypothetical protein